MKFLKNSDSISRFTVSEAYVGKKMIGNLMHSVVICIVLEKAEEKPWQYFCPLSKKFPTSCFPWGTEHCAQSSVTTLSSLAA